MPCRNVNTTLKMTPGASWTRTRARIWAAEHDARVALTLAAACFAAGTCITRCYVQIAAPDSEQGERVVATYFFGRAAYLADCVPVAKDLESMDMDDMPCKRVA